MIVAMALALEKITESEYADLEAKAEYRSEYYNGEVFAMAGGTSRHARIGGLMLHSISSSVDLRRCSVMGPDMRIRVAATRLQTYPDVSVVCGDIAHTRGREDCIENPIIIVEVLSEGTESYDRGFKFDNYKRIPSLREYVLVSQNRPRIEVLRRSKTGRWAATVAEGLDAGIALESVGATISLADVYIGIDFAQ